MFRDCWIGWAPEGGYWSWHGPHDLTLEQVMAYRAAGCEVSQRGAGSSDGDGDLPEAV